MEISAIYTTLTPNRMAATARVDEFSLSGSRGTMPSFCSASACDILTTVEPKGLSRQA